MVEDKKIPNELVGTPATADTTTTKPDSALKSFLSGGVGGICVVLVGHPLDLIKVRMQTMGPGAELSVFGTLRTTFMREGIRGLYRGVSAPITAVSPLFATSFWGYDMGKRFMRNMDSKGHEESFEFTIPQLCVAGGLSAIPTTVLMAPSERIKCLLQVQANAIEKGGTAKYSGMIDCGKQIYKEGGMRSLFRGSAATLLRDGPGSVAWFGTYEVVKREMMKAQGMDPKTGQLSPLAVLSAGGFAGMACWCVAIPPDVLKSRLQTAPEGKYSGMMDVYRTLVKEEGHAALFSGIRPALIRAFPANAACFMGMEVARDLLGFMD
uniref:Mitochondrial carrier protein n=1 Tax=Attheya septentrionalis TaxID=420275 RepID=A0A7S2UMC7_9STRA|mmetsp:Transcript_4265/g.7646  ORF Transcript_4265/g.7646 Transcript_4265/m.7646 type:complete len:323 (+) Transcript_4265:148-1116(+)|eukprot:CAMPEP_0198293066 /NCGR_PEP_ID=MMETSP1449-20131203/15211_1 /TAXON_ID=420275 /ORGANISM="Attheya septentrionalis, Strain CCMP2084" /LENGTH=322 /DNA_ID=CAMNT_0043992493 /DNA_START=71 /DNA_END=1039 /DNA_ORIENTATION=+